MQYIAYTDGSCKVNGNGGYSAIILDGEGRIIKKLYQGYNNTTNNRQEIRGILSVLEYFKEPTELLIYSDSQYVVNTIQQNWVKKWFENNDLSKKNLDLWFRIVELLDFHDVTMKWVKGHNKDKFNEEADFYAQHAATCLNRLNDEY